MKLKIGMLYHINNTFWITIFYISADMPLIATCSSSSSSGSKILLNFWYCFYITLLVCAFSYFHNGEYSNLFIVAAFPSKYFSCKTSLPVKNSYLPIFPDDKVEILAVYLSKLYWALFSSILLPITLIFSLILVLW